MLGIRGRPAVRPRRFTLLDVAFLVGITCLDFAAIAATGRAARDPTAGMTFAGSAAMTQFLIWLLFVVAGASAGRRAAWLNLGLFGFYALCGLTFLIQIIILVLIEPYQALTILATLLAMVFYWVSWS